MNPEGNASVDSKLVNGTTYVKFPVESAQTKETQSTGNIYA
jgi:hypothetical protein